MADNQLLEGLRESISSGIRTRSITTCSRWAQERRIMGGDFAGPFGFKYHPWAKGPHDSTASFNVSMKAAQMGFTEIGINRAFFILDILARDVLYVLPTALNASDFSRSRFAPALKYSPYIKRMFTDTNTINLKQAGTNTLYIRGSRGDSNLKSIPVSELILDEVDEMDQTQIWLAFERLSGQKTQNIWAISTPTIPNRGIHKLYQTTTQEHFFFKCPGCSKKIELLWPDSFELCGDGLGDPDVAKSYIRCTECGKKLDHEAKPEYLTTGIWVPTDLNADPDQRGFNINQMYSFTVSPGKIAVAYFRGMGDEGALSEFHKSKLGQPYIPDGGQVTDSKLDNCIGVHTMAGERPTFEGKRFITMGVDQGDWCHYEIDEWFFPEMGRDINVVAVCKNVFHGKFNGKIEGDWGTLDNMMREWQILHACIDAQPNTLEARRFAQRFPGYVTLVRYGKGQVKKEIQLVEEDHNRIVTATVDRTNWIDCALGRFHVQDKIILPRDTSLEYREHMKNLVRTYESDKDGNPEALYIKTGADHYAHSRTYSEIALPLAASYATNQDIASFL
jgi:DNA-directed RNA polymerase subunit RPC12/RpoP